jgi:hypothetical protein
MAAARWDVGGNGAQKQFANGVKGGDGVYGWFEVIFAFVTQC